VTAIAVIDGDTVHMGAERYQLLGIDAAEIRHAQCDAERRLGVLTKKRLEALLGTGAGRARASEPEAGQIRTSARPSLRQWRGRLLRVDQGRLCAALGRPARRLVHQGCAA